MRGAKIRKDDVNPLICSVRKPKGAMPSSSLFPVCRPLVVEMNEIFSGYESRFGENVWKLLEVRLLVSRVSSSAAFALHPGKRMKPQTKGSCVTKSSLWMSEWHGLDFSWTLTWTRQKLQTGLDCRTAPPCDAFSFFTLHAPPPCEKKITSCESNTSVSVRRPRPPGCCGCRCEILRCWTLWPLTLSLCLSIGASSTVSLKLIISKDEFPLIGVIVNVLHSSWWRAAKETGRRFMCQKKSESRWSDESSAFHHEKNQFVVFCHLMFLEKKKAENKNLKLRCFGRSCCKTPNLCCVQGTTCYSLKFHDQYKNMQHFYDVWEIIFLQFLQTSWGRTDMWL